MTPAEVAQFHVQLLCSVKIESIKVRRRYATAVFRLLGDRETSKCDHPGTRTAVRFTIVRGKITAWEQVWWRGASMLCTASHAARPACQQLRRP
jgi:hypothetical protein